MKKMYGRSVVLSSFEYPNRNKNKRRSFEDQEFEYVFYGIPKNIDDPTKSFVKAELERAYFDKTGTILSEDEIEKVAKSIYQNKGLNWNSPVTSPDIVQQLLLESRKEESFETVLGSEDLGEDLTTDLETTYKKNFLLESVLKRREERLNKSLNSSGSSSKENNLQEVTGNSPTKPKQRKKTLGTTSRIAKSKLTQKSEASREPLIQLSGENNSSNNNLLSNITNNNTKPNKQYPYFEPISSDSDSDTEVSPNKGLRKAPSLSTKRTNLLPLTRLPTLLVESPVKKPKLDMMTDYLDDHPLPHVSNGDSAPDCNVATLLNMGNTCFLNSVLYTLRFAPTFLHNLHHLLVDISFLNTKLKENRTKTSSLGRNGSAVTGSSWRSASSKDLLSIGNSDIIPKSKDQIVTEKLHALFMAMNNLEGKDASDPYQPEQLLQALREAKSLFEGNHQQDAHELFVELLSCLRVTCDELNEHIDQNPELIKPPEPTSAKENNNSKIWPVRRSWKKPLKRKDKGSTKKNGDSENEVTPANSEDNISTDSSGDAQRKKFGYNFIAEEFEGVSLHRTKCLECETVSELKEPFLEIQVPVPVNNEGCEFGVMESAIFGSLCVTSEKLCDQNKYFCENCNRYTEAVRTVLYEKLPNILVLHLKRFTTTLSKVNTYVPTPLEIRCFCESCTKLEKSKITTHRYRLSCVIMHLGASLASGHYIAYSRASGQSLDYVDCSRDISKNFISSNKEMSVLKFFKVKNFVGNSFSETQNGLGPNSKKSDIQICQSINCCGIRSKLNFGLSNRSDDWLEFDDEKVKTLSNKEFMDMLNRRQENHNTPYLLFYSKV